MRADWVGLCVGWIDLKPGFESLRDRKRAEAMPLSAPQAMIRGRPQSLPFDRAQRVRLECEELQEEMGQV